MIYLAEIDLRIVGDMGTVGLKRDRLESREVFKTSTHILCDMQDFAPSWWSLSYFVYLDCRVP